VWQFYVHFFVLYWLFNVEPSNYQNCDTTCEAPPPPPPPPIQLLSSDNYSLQLGNCYLATVRASRQLIIRHSQGLNLFKEFISDVATGTHLIDCMRSVCTALDVVKRGSTECENMYVDDVVGPRSVTTVKCTPSYTTVLLKRLLTVCDLLIIHAASTNTRQTDQESNQAD